jgi:DMSO/TMAO reductase YedYZ molybdopterin-dependent catalytic subunit
MTIGNPALAWAGQVVPVPVADPEQERRAAVEAGLVVNGAEPLNCEVPAGLLGGEVTPTARFYRRNHFPIPVLDAETWRLSVTGMVDRALSLGLPELTQLPAETEVVTLECAGNSRRMFQPPAPGEQWGFGAVSTAEWTGVPLAEVLRRAGVRPGAREVIFGGADRGTIDGAPHQIQFERSLPLADAAESGALLAWAMNGQPLPARHGYPLRLVVPGWYAVASVKWLSSIRVVEEPFGGFFQTERYMYERGSGTVVREPVRLQQVRSLITRPSSGQELAGGGGVVVRGVAWSGAAPVERVEVSVNNGPWEKARLVGVAAAHGWQQWEFLASGLRPGETSIRVRAADLSGRIQPEQPEWNRRGYGGNFIHEVVVRVR